MVIKMEQGAGNPEITKICSFLSGYIKTFYHEDDPEKQLYGAINPGKDWTLINVIGYIPDKQHLNEQLSFFEGIEEVIIVSKYSLVNKEYTQGRPVKVGRDFPDGRVEVSLNGNEFAIIAGPCAVENESQIKAVAKFISGLGLKLMRGGAYKPRTYPSSFQGLRDKGIRLFRKVADKYRLLIVSEMTEVAQRDLFSQCVDLVQIGTRNMQNYELLKAAGQTGKPVLLKRGMMADIDEFLGAAEYILQEQARCGHEQQVILCLRGIRTFDNALMRNTPDLATIAALKQKKTGLPVIFDPSHSTGDRNLVVTASKQAAVGEANGVLVEIHPEPQKALVDGPQSLDFEQFLKLLQILNPLCELEKRVLT